MKHGEKEQTSEKKMEKREVIVMQPLDNIHYFVNAFQNMPDIKKWNGALFLQKKNRAYKMTSVTNDKSIIVARGEGGNGSINLCFFCFVLFCLHSFNEGHYFNIKRAQKERSKNKTQSRTIV